MTKPYSPLRFLLVLIFGLMAMQSAFASSGSMTTVINGRSSDYYLQFSYTGVATASFQCYYDGRALYVGTSVGDATYLNQSNPTIPDGAYTFAVGPGVNATYYVQMHQWGRNHNGVSTCYNGPGFSLSSGYSNDNWTSGFTIRTHSIYAPGYSYYGYTNTTNIPNLQFTVLHWYKGSDVPEANLQYNIYRNGAYIATVAGNVYSYTDPTMLPQGTYNYEVRTQATSWGNPESNSCYFSVPISNRILQATDATLYGKSQLTWPNIAAFAPNDIAVMRNGQQIAVVNKNSTTYNDFDGVPGVVYDYSVAPIDANNNTPFAFHDNGASRPNGVIKGNVRTIYSAGVGGVVMVAYANINNTLYLDSVLTDPSGFYQFNDRFYDTSATWTIVPHKGTHGFNPDTLRRTLTMNSNNATGVDFQDTSVFTIKGKVKFSPDPNCPNCTEGGVSIYQNNVNISNTTSSTGDFSIAIQQEGTYTFKPVLYNHKFSPDSITIHVVSDSFNVNFTDLTRDTIRISVKGGCGNQVSHHDIVSINSDNGAYAKFDTFSGYGEKAVVVPAQPYTVNFIKGFANNVIEDPLLATQLGSSPLHVDVTKRDSASTTVIDTSYTIVPAHSDTLVSGQIIVYPAHRDTIIDTITTNRVIIPRAPFIYHGQITVDVVNFPFSTACPSVNGGYIVDQGDRIPLRISIKEFFAYDSTSCPVDSGQLVIYDDVSDVGAPQTVNFYQGRYDYLLLPGVPNIAAPYLKVLQFFAHVGNNTAPNWGHQILVTGHRPHTQTFVTKTPELPFFVLHAPPGSSSYSFLAQDSSVNYAYSNSYQVGGSAGPYVDAKIGAGIPIPFTGIVVGAGVEITADAQAGGDQNHNTQVNTTFTAHQQISTSNSNNGTDIALVGHQGDVYVGGSFNMIYALSDVISLKNCQVERDTELAWGANGLATNYIYTEKHITETLIPQLELLRSLAHGDTIALMQSYIDVWKQVVQKNHKNSDTTASFVQNLSYSAGAVYDYEQTAGSDSTQSIDYSTFVDVNAGVGVFFGENLDGFANTQLGVKMNFHWNMNKGTSTNVVRSKTFGYHLEDNTVGNFYSVDVKSDKVYGTPAFGLVAGTSACPHWPGTQARDSVQVTLDNYSVSNVPINTPATFTAHIVNLSESMETRTYNIQAVPESNTEGAIIKIGGQQINNSPAAFTVAAGTDLPVVLTVERGPIASDYNGLQISSSSPCDGAEGNTITFEAHFQSTCSPISLYTPSDNWLVNAASHDTLPIIFSGYNATDSNLISIGLEYRSLGGSWVPAINPPITRSRLVAPYYAYIFNTSALADGNYEVRAYANCGSQPGGRTYSQTLSGKIDRTNLQLFGTPSPADGVLNVGQDISVTFNEAIDCGRANAYDHIYSTLVRADNGQVIPDSVVCSGSSLIIYTNPPSLIDSLENVTLISTINNVYDINGNTLQQPVQWSFVVNRSKVYWSPANMNISAVTGTSATATGTMLNVGPLDSFTITHMPSWLSTPQQAVYTMTSGTPTNPSSRQVSFTVQNSLNPGHYTDTVIARASGRDLYLFVNLDVVKPHPNWSVNPASYQYSMNVTANFSTTDLNTPLSTDTRDTIAVFKGEECRGLAGISYDPYTNKYVAFITAYSNSVVGDTFTFRMWDAVPGVEYQAKERLPFVDNGTIGQPLAPYILHPQGIFQTILLTPGWNWFSLNVNAADMSTNNVLAHLHPANASIVKTDNAYAQYYKPSTGAGTWQGALTAFNTKKSYMIQLSQPDTLHLLGTAVTDTTSIQITSGWNWVGYPRQDISSAVSYLANVTVADGDLLKTQSTFTQYNSGGWAGTLNNMYPGQGYKLKAANAFNFVIPPSRSLPSWNADDNRYQQNMSVTADLQFNSVSTTQSHYLVGAFVNGTCVGVAQPIYLHSLNAYRVFITIHGDTANVTQAITYKVYDTDNDVEYEPTYDTIHVVPDSSVARVESPYVINVQTTTGINAINFADGYSLLQNVPNPFSATTEIQYVIPSAQSVSITIYDEAGRLVAQPVNGTQAAGMHKISFAQEDLQSGVYFYQMRAGDFVKTRRMLIIK